ncbi:hypothetical protein [Vulcanococcus sp. Clear-D1]|uniref:hypothetical protein n=1 Tax=Vulcanococcus sp. Clear-D1 TaxID=2766970 RepID=UPI0019BA8C1A|nr:hypothetical protein [Vulcanococcus sp. Clear-D1]MBD1194639.1 hypothetical protein [Vulcanococcus sp. Clear-D1]
MTVVRALLQQRHNYYRWLLIVEVIALISLRPLQQAPQLVSVVYLIIGGVGVLMDSPLLPQNRLMPQLHTAVIPQKQHNYLRQVIRRRRWLQYGWLCAAGVEVLWQLSLLLRPTLALHLSVLHMLVWLCLLLYELWALMTALAEEPMFSGDLLMGAAAGYLLIGFTGGIVLNSLVVLDPAAFTVTGSPYGELPAAIAYAPHMLGAAFGSLTTLGSPVLNNQNLTSVSASAGITIVGQLYVAILIAGVLGKPRQIATVRKASHQARRGSAPSPRLRRKSR